MISDFTLYNTLALYYASREISIQHQCDSNFHNHKFCELFSIHKITITVICVKYWLVNNATRDFNIVTEKCSISALQCRNASNCNQPYLFVFHTSYIIGISIAICQYSNVPDGIYYNV